MNDDSHFGMLLTALKVHCHFVVFFLFSTGCTRQPSLPSNSRFNVTSVLNDSVWFGTGKVLRLKESGQQLENVKQFNLLVFTDIDYPGMGGGPNPNTDNGCLDPECTRSQALVIYNIPLKKGRTSIAKLNKRSKLKHEIASLMYIGNSGGLRKQYVYQGLKPSWVRVTKFDRKAGTMEGRFALSFSDDEKVYNRILTGSPTARFVNGLFRIKITDVLLR